MSWTESAKSEETNKSENQTTEQKILDGLKDFTGWQVEDTKFESYPHPVASSSPNKYDPSTAKLIWTFDSSFEGYPHTGAVKVFDLNANLYSLFKIEANKFEGYPHTGSIKAFNLNAKLFSIFVINETFEGYPHPGTPSDYEDYYTSDDEPGDSEPGLEYPDDEFTYVAQGVWKHIDEKDTLRNNRYKKGYTHPELYRIKAIEENSDRNVTVDVYGLNSYRLTEYYTHDEDSTDSEIP